MLDRRSVLLASLATPLLWSRAFADTPRDALVMAKRIDDIISNLRNFAEVSTEPDMAIVCIVGENLRSDTGLFGRAVTCLQQIPLRLVSQAASRRNITFVIRDADVPGAMARLGVRTAGSATWPDIHHPSFRVDESCIGVGVKVLADVASSRGLVREPTAG